MAVAGIVVPADAGWVLQAAYSAVSAFVHDRTRAIPADAGGLQAAYSAEPTEKLLKSRLLRLSHFVNEFAV